MIVKIRIFREKPGFLLGLRGKVGVTENFYASLLGEYKTEDTLDGRCLSSSVRTEIAEDFTLLYR